MSALIIVDIQNDFLNGGKLEMPNNPNTIIDKINQLQKLPVFDKIIMTQHIYPSEWKNVRSTLIENTYGSEISSKLNKSDVDIIITKQLYSAFASNNILYSYLKSNNITTTYICGLAYDYCVGETAIDSSKYKFRTYIIKDLTKSYYDETEKAMSNKISNLDIEFINSSDIFNLYL